MAILLNLVKSCRPIVPHNYDTSFVSRDKLNEYNYNYYTLIVAVAKRNGSICNYSTRRLLRGANSMGIMV